MMHIHQTLWGIQKLRQHELYLMLSRLMDLAKAFLQAFHSASPVDRYVKRLSCP